MSARRSSLVDQFGRPMAYEFFEAGDRYNSLDSDSPALYRAARDTDDNLKVGTWLQILNSGRFLFANVPLIRGALLEQAAYSFPLTVRYAGRDKDWGKIVEAWIYEWQKSNNVRGWPYDQLTNSRIRLLGRKVDGDIATIQTFGQDEFPKIQLVRAHRIGTRDSKDTVQKGKYKGRRIQNGVILDDVGAPLAYRLLGDKPAEDEEIPAESMFLTYRPDYSDQARGISELIASIRSFADLKRLREYEMRAQQILSAIVLLEKNENGETPPGADFIQSPAAGTDASGTASGLISRTYEKGMALYFRSGTGSGLEAFRGDRPSADAQAFEDKIVSGAFYGIEWDPNFALAIKEPGGAWARTILQKINRAIGNNVREEERAQRREITYAVNKAIALKILPRPKDEDTFSWEFQLGIQLITADSGNEEQAKREAYKLGLSTLQRYCSPNGDWWEEHREQRDKEVRDLLARAAAVRKDFPELSLQEILALFEQRTPNANSPTPGEPLAEPAPPIKGK